MSQEAAHTIPFRQVFLATLLIAGTSIGGGMLAIPVVTAEAGFVPSIVGLLLCWLTMFLTSKMMIDVLAEEKKPINLIGLFCTTGKVRFSYWIIGVYFMLFYSLLVAYLLVIGRFLQPTLACSHVSALIVAAACGIVLFLCKKSIGWINSIFVFVMLSSFMGFLVYFSPYVESSRLEDTHFSVLWRALPCLFTSFGFQGTLPTLASMLGYDKKRLTLACFFGSLVPLVVYIFWQYVMLGALPKEGEIGLLAARSSGVDVTVPLSALFPRTPVSFLGGLFALTAVITSLIGVALGMRDFLADIAKTYFNIKLPSWVLVVLVFLVPTLCGIADPSLFLRALELAGGIGCAILLGILPLMVWFRYKKIPLLRMDGIIGGLVFLFILFEIGVECRLLFF